MPRIPLHALIWSSDQGLYELYTQGQLEQRFRPADEAAWLAWLGEATSFAFHGAGGSLNVYQEARPRGGLYWYAYHTTRSRTRKRYLGSSAQMTFARLEKTAQVLAGESMPTSRIGPPAEQLLSHRLAAPRLPHALVERERLLSALNGALSSPLTLLAAPAGWGKTTLLSTWASQHPAQIAWLSLDELDTSSTRFWVSLIAALRRCGSYAPGLGETAVALLQSPQPPPLVTCLSTLLYELEGREAPPAPFVLIVDDYQVITDPAIHEGMSIFLEHLPVHLHLILSSRVDPDLPLARWRVRGQLTEIRVADLSFRESEASHFLGQMLSPPLSEEEVSRLVNRTEGWIAGLHLAALALQKREDRAAFLRAFTGSHRYVLDYVQQEILRQQHLPIQRFLCQVAVLTRMNAALCQAVTGEPASQDILETLERSNLFVVPLDEQRQWYRLHDLFREALLAQVQASQPDLLPHMHQRAAQWYERHGELREAIAHALAAPDYPLAASLMEQAAPAFWLSGEAKTVHTWIEVRAILQRGDTERLRQLAQETEALPQDEEVGWNIIPLFLTFRLIAVLQGEGASLIPRLLVAKQQMMEAGDSLATIRVMSWLALAYTQAAQLHRAKRECLEGVTLGEHIDGRTFQSGYLYYQLFEVSSQNYSLW
jgi:LuxR family maltose regulon positive regulatory protein